MNRKSRIAAYALGGLSLSVLVGSLAVAAGSEMPGGHRFGGHGGHGFFSFLNDIDADDSGSVSRAEIEAFHAQRAAEIDADQDGEVTVAELQAFHDAQRQKRMEQRLAAMDGDGDGKVTVAELQAASTWRLARFDRDGDGTIELRGHGRHHGHDNGHDGGPVEQDD